MGLPQQRERHLSDTLALIQALAETPIVEIEAERAIWCYRTETKQMTDLRWDFHARLKRLRNQQRVMQIERETYYELALQRIRAVTEAWAVPQIDL